MVYPKYEEEQVEVLNRCKIKGSWVMFCPCCSVVFDKEDAKEWEKLVPQQPSQVARNNKNDNFVINKRGIPRSTHLSRTYVLHINVPWVRGSSLQKKIDRWKWRSIKVGVGSSYHDHSQVSKKYSYTSKNYMRKNSMTRTQWRRHQHKKKVAFETQSSRKIWSCQAMAEVHMEKRLVKTRLFPHFPPIAKFKEK